MYNCATWIVLKNKFNVNVVKIVSCSFKLANGATCRSFDGSLAFDV
ncbi:hypothetical protein BH10CHL1_BH10CHL1_22180 [soil metagenome]